MAAPDQSAQAVEAYIESTPHYAVPICRKLRALIRKAGPMLTETIKWGGPAYLNEGLVFGFAAFKQHVKLHFFQGAWLTDPDNLFTGGEGNASSRSISFTSLSELHEEPLQRLLQEAVLLDSSGETKRTMRSTKRALKPGRFSTRLLLPAAGSTSSGLLRQRRRRHASRESNPRSKCSATVSVETTGIGNNARMVDAPAPIGWHLRCVRP